MNAADFAAYFASAGDVVALLLSVIVIGWLAGLVALAVSVALSERG